MEVAATIGHRKDLFARRNKMTYSKQFHDNASECSFYVQKGPKSEGLLFRQAY